MLTDLQRSIIDKRNQVEILAEWAGARDMREIQKLCYHLSGALTDEFLRHMPPCPAASDPAPASTAKEE